MAGEWNVDGWKAIAETVGLSVATCTRMARRATDPLPTYRQLGHTVGKRFELEAWKRRQPPRAARARS